MQELHELLWSMVDSVTDLQEGISVLVREIGRLRADHETRMAAVLRTLEGDAAAHQAALDAIAQVPLLVRRVDEIAHLLTDVAGSVDDVRAAGEVQQASATDVGGRLAGVEQSLADLRQEAERERRAFRKDLRSLRADLVPAPEPVPAPPAKKPPAPASAPARRSAAATKKPAERAPERPRRARKSG